MAVAAKSGAAILWETYSFSRSREARDDLLIFYAPLVKYVAGRLGAGLPSHVDGADLVSYGMFGLIQAIEKFEPSRGIKFETYAITRIRGSILDELRAIDWVPRSIRSLARRVENAYSHLEARTGRTPSDSEVAKEIGISEAELLKVFSQISYTSVVALDQVLPGGEGGSPGTLFDRIDSGRAQPASELEQKESQMMLRQSIASLGQREKTVLTLYYYENLTMSEIGAILGVSEGRVCQIHTKAVLQLKAKLPRSDW